MNRRTLNFNDYKKLNRIQEEKYTLVAFSFILSFKLSILDMKVKFKINTCIFSVT